MSAFDLYRSIRSRIIYFESYDIFLELELEFFLILECMESWQFEFSPWISSSFSQMLISSMSWDLLLRLCRCFRRLPFLRMLRMNSSRDVSSRDLSIICSSSRPAVSGFSSPKSNFISKKLSPEPPRDIVLSWPMCSVVC